MGIILLFMIGFLGIKPCVVLSGSMEPALPTGSLVLVNTFDKEPDKGDIINYLISGCSITHRVIKTSENSYKTKGDANKIEDFYCVYPYQIQGSVLFHIPLLGYYFYFVQSHKILFSGVIIYAVFYFFMIFQKKRG